MLVVGDELRETNGSGMSRERDLDVLTRLKWFLGKIKPEVVPNVRRLRASFMKP